MASVTIEITDAAKTFVDQEVASGRFKNGSALVEMLLTRAMWLRDRDHSTGFSVEEKKRIDQMLLEAVVSFERGEYTKVQPREFEDLARRLVAEHQTKQAP